MDQDEGSGMGINIKNARRLIKCLEDENNPVGFGMDRWFDHNGDDVDDASDVCRIAKDHPCGTAACLAGHAALLAWQSGDVEIKVFSNIRDTAEKWLGLGYWEARNLFHGHWGGHQLMVSLDSLTKEEAIAELNRMIDARYINTEESQT